MLEVGLLARDDGVGQTLQGGSSGLDALNEGLGFAEKDAAGRGIGLATGVVDAKAKAQLRGAVEVRCAHAVQRPDDDIGNDVERAGFSGDRIGREGLEHAQRLVENGGLAVGELEKRRTVVGGHLVEMFGDDALEGFKRGGMHDGGLDALDLLHEGLDGAGGADAWRIHALKGGEGFAPLGGGHVLDAFLLEDARVVAHERLERGREEAPVVELLDKAGDEQMLARRERQAAEIGEQLVPEGFGGGNALEGRFVAGGALPGLVGLVDGRLRLGCVEFGIILAAVVPPVVVMLLSARLRVVGGLCRLLHFKQGVGFEHEFDFAEKLLRGHLQNAQRLLLLLGENLLLGECGEEMIFHLATSGSFRRDRSCGRPGR